MQDFRPNLIAQETDPREGVFQGAVIPKQDQRATLSDLKDSEERPG